MDKNFLINTVDANTSIETYDRFDRRETMPVLNEAQLKKAEQEIQQLLDQCNTIIGPEADDEKNVLLKVKPGVYNTTYTRITNPEYLRNTQPHYLTGRAYKCVSFLYTKYYDLRDFGYRKHNDKKKEKLEQIYEKAYLTIKKSGLLRNIVSAYYPKSLIRRHADKTGLTAYINGWETTCRCYAHHAVAAGRVFNGYKNWIASLNQYINEEMEKSQ